MDNQEQEKFKVLEAFREEIRKIIAEAKLKQAKGELFDNNFARMDEAGVGELQEADWKWWRKIREEQPRSREDFENLKVYFIAARGSIYQKDIKQTPNREMFWEALSNEIMHLDEDLAERGL